VIVVSLCLMTMDYDMIVSPTKCLFQIDIYDCIDIWNMWLTCVSSCRKHASISLKM